VVASVGFDYSFTPIGFDADGDALEYSIKGKPAWLMFSSSTGILAGIPSAADVGIYSDIIVGVSDGKASIMLAAFTLTVAPPSVSPAGSATLSWSPPTQNTDGSNLADLAGFWIYHGSTQNNLFRLQNVASPMITQFLVTGLAPGIHYFAVSAYNSSSGESALSEISSKIIP
jgi:hypothetical protein